MTQVVDKIERRLGVRVLNLPKEICKDVWANEVIAKDTIPTFSRFFPYGVKVRVTKEYKKDGYYLLDECVGENVEIIGIRDVDWSEFGKDSIKSMQTLGYGIYDFYSNNWGLDDIGIAQMRADHVSLFNNGLYPEFVPPNKVRLLSQSGGKVSDVMDGFPLMVFINHPINLMTISPTMMELFEKLAICDVATFLVGELKYYDNLETVFGNIDLKIQQLEDYASRREDVIQKLEESYVSPANQYQPIMFTI